MHPIGGDVGQTVALLEKEDVRSDFRACRTFEGVVGQSDSSDQLGPLRNIFTDGCRFLVHGALAGDKGHDAARSDFVQSSGKKVIVNEKIVLVVAFVRHLEAAEGNVADGHIKKAVREVCLLKPLNSDGGLLIKLLGNAPADGIQFDAVDFGVCQTVRPHADEVSNAAGWLQNIAGLEVHVLQRLIHGTDHHGWRIERGEGGLPCCRIFVLVQQRFQLRILAVSLIKAIGQATPSNIFCKNLLFLRGGKAVFCLQPFQQTDGTDIVVETLAGRTDADGIIGNAVIVPLCGGDLGVQHKGRYLFTELLLWRRRQGRFFFSRYIDRLRAAFLKCEHILPGLL